MLRAALRTTARLPAARAAPAARQMGGGGAHPPSPNHVWAPAGGWFADARVFFVTTLFVMIVLARRQFASRARTLAVSAHQSPSEPMADKGAMKTDTGSANPFT